MLSIISIIGIVMITTVCCADENEYITLPDQDIIVSKGGQIIVDEIGSKVELECLFESKRKRSVCLKAMH